LLLVAMLGAGALWALVPRHRRSEPAGEQRAEAPVAPARRQVDLAQLRQAIEVLSRAHPDPAAAGDRRAALADLLAEENPADRMTLLLEAAAADPTPPAQDPLWADLVSGLAGAWNGQTVGAGMDLVWAEQRPRARQAVVAALSMIALERADELGAAQRQRLIETLIDVHNQLPPAQQPNVQVALRKIAGNDVADVMEGKALDPNYELEAHREQKRAVEEAQQLMAAQQQQGQRPQ
jgi:hypothetical protein